MTTKVYNRVIETSSNTPSGASPQSISLSGTSPALTFVGAGSTAGRLYVDKHSNGDVVPSHLYQTNNPSLWIKGKVTFATGSPNTLSVASADITDGSSGAGALPTWTGPVTCVEEGSAEDLTDLWNLAQSQVPGGRLALISGKPVTPEALLLPLSTDTAGDTVTFNRAHGFTSGTVATVIPDSGGSGLLYSTKYYLNAASSTAVSFHLTLAAALAGTSKVDLVASLLSNVIFAGFAGSTVYYTPHKSNIVTLWDGTQWRPFVFTEQSYSVASDGTAAWDVFGYVSGGALAIEKLEWLHAFVVVTAASPAVVAWTANGLSNGDPVVFTTAGTLPTGLSPGVIYYVVNVTANQFSVAATYGGTAINTTGSVDTPVCHQLRQRGTAVTLQDGRPCKAGDKTRLWLGSYMTIGGVIEDSRFGRQLANAHHMLPAGMLADYASTHNYDTSAWRVWNNDWTTALPFFLADAQTIFLSAHHDLLVTVSGTAYGSVSVDIPEAATVDGVGTPTTGALRAATAKGMNVSAGYHQIYPVQFGFPTGGGHCQYNATQISAKIER